MPHKSNVSASWWFRSSCGWRLSRLSANSVTLNLFERRAGAQRHHICRRLGNEAGSNRASVAGIALRRQAGFAARRYSYSRRMNDSRPRASRCIARRAKTSMASPAACRRSRASTRPADSPVLRVVRVGVAEAEIDIECVGREPFALQVEALAFGAALVDRVAEAAGRQRDRTAGCCSISGNRRCPRPAAGRRGTCPWCRLRSSTPCRNCRTSARP